jgi:hypothetical protein
VMASLLPITLDGLPRGRLVLLDLKDPSLARIQHAGVGCAGRGVSIRLMVSLLLRNWMTLIHMSANTFWSSVPGQAGDQVPSHLTLEGRHGPPPCCHRGLGYSRRFHASRPAPMEARFLSTVAIASLGSPEATPSSIGLCTTTLSGCPFWEVRTAASPGGRHGVP